MKKLWWLFFIQPGLVFAELAVVHNEAKENGKIEVAHVDAGGL